MKIACTLDKGHNIYTRDVYEKCTFI